jgi:hypothetical protein
MPSFASLAAFDFAAEGAGVDFRKEAFVPEDRAETFRTLWTPARLSAGTR